MLAAVAVLAGIGLRWLPLSLRNLLLRFVAAFVIVLALAGTLIWALIFYSGLPKDLLPAVTTAGAIAIGWIVTFGFREYEQARIRDQQRRDVLTALRSEVFTAFQTLDATDWRSDSAIVQGLIAAGGNGPGAYAPFTASESPPIVFQALAEDISVLHESEIGAILRFYAALTDLSTLVGDCRDPGFAALSADRRIRVHQRLTDTRLAALHWALQALYRINVSLGVRNAEKIPRTGFNKDTVIDSNANP